MLRHPRRTSLVVSGFSRTLRRLLVSALVLACSMVSIVAQQSTSPPHAVPIEPIAAIVDAFRSHSIVAFSEAHGNRQMARFELSVLRDSRVTAVINDVVIEGANARYQEAMDRYVRGDNVPCETLRLVWRETTQAQTLGPNSCDIPERYRVVREMNMQRPRERQLRVLLADPPIDWSVVRTAGDLRKWIELRDSHGAEVISREVLAKNRRALVVFGQGHLQRKNLLANYESEGWREQWSAFSRAGPRQECSRSGGSTIAARHPQQSHPGQCRVSR